ncbi:MAG: replication-associated recombination protein A [Patescibacteria group bacterium]
MDLFEAKLAKNLQLGAPLAERMRPQTLSDYEGQMAAISDQGFLKAALQSDQLPSMIFWGPPGVGKTTLGQIIANMTKSRYMPFSAVSGTVKDVRDLIKDAETRRKFYAEKTILFVDEIHRFNKAQQDAFLPAVEKGIVTLIGATTENPSFQVNAALLSRCRVVVLNKLETPALEKILRRALKDKERGLGNENLQIDEATLTLLATISDGDARSALNTLEIAAHIAPRNTDGSSTRPSITEDLLKQALQRTHLLYDRNGEEHYNIISALHKSMRGHDANAALYWLGRMLEAGEEPLYIARRLVRFASEDIGLADPNALVQAVTTHQACHMLGMPECNVILAQCVAYLAKAPKSNALYEAYNAVQQDIQALPNEPVPLHLRNAPTKLMKNLDYGKGYKYTPAFTNPTEAKQDYLPDKLKNRKYLKDTKNRP